jgi:hypothetical protein
MVQKRILLVLLIASIVLPAVVFTADNPNMPAALNADKQGTAS